MFAFEAQLADFRPAKGVDLGVPLGDAEKEVRLRSVSRKRNTQPFKTSPSSYSQGTTKSSPTLLTSTYFLLNSDFYVKATNICRDILLRIKVKVNKHPESRVSCTWKTSTPEWVTARLILIPSPSWAGWGLIPYMSSFLATSSRWMSESAGDTPLQTDKKGRALN